MFWLNVCFEDFHKRNFDLPSNQIIYLVDY